MPATVHDGDSVHIVVTERNSGDSILHDVSVTGGPGGCPAWTAVGVFNGILAPGATQQFDMDLHRHPGRCDDPPLGGPRPGSRQPQHRGPADR